MSRNQSDNIIADLFGALFVPFAHSIDTNTHLYDAQGDKIGYTDNNGHHHFYGDKS